MSLKNRLPSLQETLAVYGIITLIISGWTLIKFFWKLPSWDFFLTFGEISTIFAYSMASNLLESLIVLLTPLLCSLLFPKNWFKDFFRSASSLMVIAGLAYVMYIASHMTSDNDLYPANLVRLIPIIGVLILVLSPLLGRVSFIKKFLDDLTERAAIFSYIFLPIGLISMLVVIARNFIR